MDHVVPTLSRVSSASTRLFGRDAEVRRLEELLAQDALITVVGPPGIGKTSLVASVVANVDRHVSCDLRAHAGAAGMLAAIAASISIVLPVGSSAQTQDGIIAEVLAGRGPMVLVLDNFEHMTEWASYLGGWLESAPHLRIVVTSRQRLGIPDEACLPLGPLPVPAAIELLVSRANRIRPGFATLAAGDDPALARVVVALDQLPLAIVLASTRAAALTVKDMEASLHARFELLVASQAGTASGHRSLREAIDSSWKALAPGDQQILASTSVFRGGFTVAALASVVQPALSPAAALAAVERLGDRSLLVVEDGGASTAMRFGLLQSIHDYLVERLEQLGLAAEARGRHARYFVEEGERAAGLLRGREAVAAYERLDVEHDNLLAAHVNMLDAEPGLAARAALVLAERYAVGGKRSLHQSLYANAVLAAHADGDVALRASALRHAAEVARVAGNVDEIAAQLVEARELARATADRNLEGLVLRTMGKTFFQAGKLDDARRCFEAARQLHLAAGAHAHAAAASASIGLLCLLEGRSSEACEIAERALDVQRREGDRRAEGVTLNLLGEALHHQGRLAEARAHLEDAVPIHRSMGNRLGEGIARGNLAYVLCELNQLDLAQDQGRRSLAVFLEQGDRRHQVWMHLALGGFAWSRGERDTARSAYFEALEHARLARVPRLHGAALYHLGALFASEGAVADATAALARSRTILESVGDVEHLAACEVASATLHVARARAAWRAGDAEAAASSLGAARHCLALGERTDPLPPVGPRIAALLFRRALGDSFDDLARDLPAAVGQPMPATVLHVASDGRWFALDGQPRVELGRRRAARLVLARLLELAGASPLAGLSLDDVFAIGWPGENIKPHAALLRSYGVIHTLRELGLRDRLLTRDDGYVLDPRADVRSAGV